MRPSNIFLLSLSTHSLAQANVEKRQTSDVASSKASQLSSAVSQLIALYVPTSVYPALSSAASAHTLTGDVQSLLLSGLTASSVPEWIAAVPTQYSANIASLESKVGELKSVVSVGSISGAPRVVTSTGEGGIVAVTTVPGVVASGTGSSTGSGASSTGSGASSTGTSSASESTTVLSGTNRRTSTSTQAVASTSSSRTSSGFAVATDIPAMVMGVAGLLGLVAVL